VRSFVAQHDSMLAGLTKREALKWLDKAGSTRPA